MDITSNMSARTPGEVFSRRLCAAAAASVVVQILFSRVLVLALKLDFLHPATWLVDSLRAFNFINLLQLSVVTAAQAYIFACTCVSPPRRRFSRFHMLLDLFTLQNLAFAIFSVLTGYFMLGFCLNILTDTYRSLSKLCTTQEGHCLDENRLLMECAGMWFGLYYFFKNHTENVVLVFPHVHRRKVQQIRVSLMGNVCDGLKNSVKPTLYFIILYIIWGNRPRSALKDIYDLHLEDAPLDSIVTMVSSGTWLTLWFYSSLFFASMYNMNTVFATFLTEPMTFSVNSTTILSLSEALGHRWQYIGMLATLDFRQMAHSDERRRAEVFSVSMPGGHPRTWNMLLEENLKTIDTFRDELESIHNPRSDIESSVMPCQWSYSQPNIRNMAVSPQLQIKDMNRNHVDETVIDKLRVVVQSQVKKILQKPGISYFFKELPDWKLCSLLGRAQPVMWTCEGLASITTASLTEDHYGIVQNDLHRIIASLIQLKQELDKLSKTGLIPKKQANDAFTAKMKTALSSSVRRSIYQITTNFSKYINDINLNAELRQAVQPFLVFKEC